MKIDEKIRAEILQWYKELKEIPKRLEEKNKLEKICTFVKECDIVKAIKQELNICRQNYVDCSEYDEIIRKKLEEYNNE